MAEEVVLMKGNEAIAHAAIRCGADGYFGYPITPQSEVLETLGESGGTAAELLKRPGVHYELLAKVIGRGQDVSAAMALRIETEIRYAGYIAREQRAIHEVQRHENVVIPDDFDYAPLETVTLEAREKLAKIRPRTLAQAGRIPGVSPSDLAQLSIALMKAGKTAAE